MKAFVVQFSFITVLLFFFSCKNDGSYYEQLSEQKTISNRILDLNKSINEIRKQEKGKISKEGLDFISYEYTIGNNDSFALSYLFDEKGCYEISIDCYFAKKDDALNVLEGIKVELTSSEYGIPTDDNYLLRWKNSKESVSIELDYKNTDRGLLVLTIMANA